MILLANCKNALCFGGFDKLTHQNRGYSCSFQTSTLPEPSQGQRGSLENLELYLFCK